MKKQNKGQRTRTAAYNSAYTEYLHKVVPAEGLDIALLVSAHGYAAWITDHNFAPCRCYGSGAFWKKIETADGPRAVPDQCFGCQGKGYQDRADQKRDWGYWNFYARIGE